GGLGADELHTRILERAHIRRSLAGPTAFPSHDSRLTAIAHGPGHPDAATSKGDREDDELSSPPSPELSGRLRRMSRVDDRLGAGQLTHAPSFDTLSTNLKASIQPDDTEPKSQHPVSSASCGRLPHRRTRCTGMVAAQR